MFGLRSHTRRDGKNYDRMNDKVKHIIAGIIIGVVFAVLIKIFWIRDLMILSAGVALLAGIAKEIIWDKWFKKGTPEFADAWFTFWGGLFSSILMYFL